MKKSRVLLAALALAVAPVLVSGLTGIAQRGAARSAFADSPGGARVTATYTLPDTPLGAFQNAVLPGSITNDRRFLLGGIGSDLWRSEDDREGEFWMVTDRGPNGLITTVTPNRRTFPLPTFDPMILRVRARHGAIQVLQTIPIVGQSGTPVTGISNTSGRDEIPYDFSGTTTFPFNPCGLDTEGLVRTRHGDFWLVDEYSPSLIKVDRTGKVVKRFVPEGLSLPCNDYPVSATLPAILGKRKGNRGFEGITMSPNEKTLFMVVQSPLSNPTAAVGNPSRNTRILAFDVATEKVVAEYVYRFEVASEFAPGAVATDMKISAMVALNRHTLLIDERTDLVAKLYRVDLRKATNILGTQWDNPATSPSLEALTDPATAGVTVLPKSLVVDLSTLPGIPQKIEGVAIVDDHTIAISNDNDFDIGAFDANGNNQGAGVKNQILYIRLPQSLDD